MALLRVFYSLLVLLVGPVAIARGFTLLQLSGTTTRQNTATENNKRYHSFLYVGRSIDQGSSSTSLFGIRRKLGGLKRRLSRRSNKSNTVVESSTKTTTTLETVLSKQQQQQLSFTNSTTVRMVPTPTTLSATPTTATIPAPPTSRGRPSTTSSISFSETTIHRPTTNSVAMSRAQQAIRTNTTFVNLQPAKRPLTRLETEFRGMLLHFTNYTQADIMAISDPRQRALFEGIAASAVCVPVYRAFEILFEDLAPLRLAGRVVFRRLSQFMTESLKQKDVELEFILNTTGVLRSDVRQLEEIRLMFVSTASQWNGAPHLTLEQVADSGILTMAATQVLGFETLDDLLNQLDADQDGKLTFVELMTGLWKCSEQFCGIEHCNPQAVLHNLLLELNERPIQMNPDMRLNKKFSDRYDDMVTSFVQWEHLLPEPKPDESRRMQVIRGCFVGAKVPEVVNALRIVYCDYAGLRVAGDIIFKLVRSRLSHKKGRNPTK